MSLTLKNITKQYTKNGPIVVDEFSLQIEEGEFIVFVGPSGCGKSTTLRMIAGLEEITGGELYINDHLVNNVEPKNRDIAMVFQNYALYPHMTVYDNIAFGLKINKVSKKEIKEKVNEAARILGLLDYLDRKPSALSGGQKQRVALGRAIVRDASTFLMDEPLSNLDAKLRVQMRAEIINLHKRLKTTTIYVTHDQTEALTMATRIVILDKGKIMQVGTPIEVYNTPENLFVAQFIGSPSMNIFEATFDGTSITIGEYTFNLNDRDKEMLQNQGYTNKKVYFGIRPENVIECSTLENPSEYTCIPSKVRVNELLGSEFIIYSELDGSEFIARMDVHNKSKPGDVIDFTFNMDEAHYFDFENEKRIK